MTTIENLERQIAALRATDPVTPAGWIRRDIAIHELQNEVFGLKLQAMQARLKAQRAEFDAMVQS